MTTRGPLPLWLTMRVFWRSLFLQAGYNPEGLQNLGLVYALLPALEHFYPDEQARLVAVRRHLKTFNTHPYVAAAIIGGIVFHEAKVSRGDEGAESPERFKDALMGPLAALGDGFFWLSLKPAVGAFSAALVPFIGAWAGLVFLVTYNLVHLTARLAFYRLGLHRGAGMLSTLQRLHLPAWSERLRGFAAVCAGGLAGFLAVGFGAQAGPNTLELTAGTLFVAFVAYWLARRQLSPYALLYTAALAAFGLGVAS